MTLVLRVNFEVIFSGSCNTILVCYIRKIPTKPYPAYLCGYFHSFVEKAVYVECNTLYNYYIVYYIM